MKLVRFLHEDKVYNGALDGDEVTAENLGVIRLNEIKLLAPCTPSKIVLAGLNYKDHALELGMGVPDEPIIFIKPPTSIIGPGEPIIYPPASSRVDYEAELAVVIKTEAKNVSDEDADSCILGYTCLNDVTARDIQKQDVQWTRSKSYDTFAPLGPWIETDIDPSGLNIRSYVNGQVRQDSNTSEFIFGIPKLIEFISSVMTLVPGDVISTGTPAGVGEVKVGDEVTVEIEGIGRLTNYVERVK